MIANAFVFFLRPCLPFIQRSKYHNIKRSKDRNGRLARSRSPLRRRERERTHTPPLRFFGMGAQYRTIDVNGRCRGQRGPMTHHATRKNARQPLPPQCSSTPLLPLTHTRYRLAGRARDEHIAPSAAAHAGDDATTLHLVSSSSAFPPSRVLPSLARGRCASQGSKNVRHPGGPAGRPGHARQPADRRWAHRPAAPRPG